MNIAFFTPKMIVGGAENYILAKTQWLLANGHRVVVVSEGGENVAALPFGVTHYTLSYEAPFVVSAKFIDKKVEELCAIIINEKIDIIEAHNVYPIYYSYLCGRKIGVKFVYNLLNELSHTAKFYNPINFLISEIDSQRRFYTLTSQMNSFVERVLKKRLNPVILPIPVEPVPKIETGDGGYVLAVCRFSFDKMYLLPLIEGFSDAYCKGLIDKKYRLKIVGDGPLYSTVKQAAEVANTKAGVPCVELLGTVVGGALFELYAKCTLYVGMGTTVLQCAQYFKPVVKVAIEAHTMPYAWGLWGMEDGDQNKLCAYNEPKERKTSFENIISQTLKNASLREQAAKSGAKIIQQGYSLDTIMEEWQKSYQELIALPQKQSNLLHCKTLLYNMLMRTIYRGYRLLRR